MRRDALPGAEGAGQSADEPRLSLGTARTRAPAGRLRVRPLTQRGSAQTLARGISRRAAIRRLRGLCGDRIAARNRARGLVPPQSLTGKALAYLAGQWEKLETILDDGRIPLDTKLVEIAIRPCVVGRKNWLSADTVRGAQASASLYSLVETAKASDLEPYAYLRHVFAVLPRAKTLAEIEALLPHRLDKNRLQDPRRNVSSD